MATKTPNLFAGFPSGTRRSPAYFGSIHEKVAGDMYNYFNAEDNALWWWRRNNYGWLGLGGKPASGYTYDGRSTSRYNESHDSFKRGETKLSVYNPDQLFEIFAFAIKPRSNALGAVSEPVGRFTPVNLSKHVDDSFNKDKSAHSKQFNSNIASEWKYWEQAERASDFETRLLKESV